MRAMKWTSLLVLASAALLLGACTDANTPSDTLDFCSGDADCPFGTFCEGGVCSAGLGPCGEFDDCPVGQICRHGACVADGQTDGGADGDDGGDGGGDEVQGGPDLEIVSPPPSGDPPAFQLNFGNVAVGVATEQQVVVENTGDEDLRILQINLGLGAGNEDFSVPTELLDALPLVVTPGEQAAIDVVYLASDGTTDHGVLDIISNDPDEPSVRIELLSEFKGEQSVAASPASLEFGDIPVGQASQPLTLTVANDGTGNAVLMVEDVRFGLIQNPDFSMQLLDVDGQPVGLPALLNTGDALDTIVTYQPQDAEADTDVVVIISDDPLQQRLEVPISGTGVVGSLEVAPAPVALGRVRIGELAEQTVTITNSGGAPLSLTGVSLTDTNADWSLTSADLDLANLGASPHALGPDESATVLLAFSPAAAGASGGSLVIDHTGPDAQNLVAISAEGYLPAAVELDPAPPDLIFGDVQIDVGTGQSETRSLPLTIRNTGGEPLQITAIARAPGTSLEFSWTPASLAPIDVGAEAVLNVAFTPSNAGDKMGLLLVDTNDPDIAYDGTVGRFAVNVQARGTDPFIFVSPAASHDYGVTNIAQHKELDLVIRNASAFPLSLDNVRLTAGSSGFYSLSNLPAMPMVIPNAAVEVHVTVNYDPNSGGVHTGAVEILSSDIGNPVITITLTGDCQGCPPGMADCDPGVPGCETDVTSDPTNCGQCGEICEAVHGSNTCTNSLCVPACDPLWGDCDNDPTDGCETPTNTLDDCGACNASCSLPHSTETCGAGTCEVQSCDDGYSDCSGAAGCETHTYQDPANCGACNNTCTNAHGSTACIANDCTPVCDPLWGNCDGDPDDGCETPTNTLANCGSCNTSCALNHASETCTSGSCEITSCDSGWCNLDGLPGNGCEHDLDVNPSCNSYIDIGSISGDENNDHVEYTGRGEMWFRLRVNETYEDPLSCLYLSAIVQLVVPSGTNYDLFVYCDDCNSTSGSSSNGGSTNEYVENRWDEGCIWPGIPDGSDDGRYVFIKVQFTSGNVCSTWTLHADGNYAVANNTCSTP